MVCGRCECGRRSARRVTQKVGVLQHSTFRGILGRQELVAKVLACWREAWEGRSVVCVLPADYAFGVTPEVPAVVAELEPAFGS